ncbi:hypothetical protein [Acuticoccus mangrovi]|uniref:Uncharacterized protein n=1 Tax=Acuticoccus mangrovi TaxID=2796142 RepID=A0A934IKY1_9HYPH|nr:hypothetical protein [Acuticoccus mangrovi]MBJ3778413.1 hypothetical protein [Acuticoccus mangrovi]
MLVESKSSQIKPEDRLTNKEKEYLKILNDNMKEIRLEMSEVLKRMGINLYVDNFSLSSDPGVLEKHPLDYGACCEDGTYVAEGWMCDWIGSR